MTTTKIVPISYSDLDFSTDDEAETMNIIKGPSPPPRKLMSKELKAMCGNLICELLASPRSFYFSDYFPFDKWNLTDFADYFDANYMHLNIIKTKIENDEYETPGLFASDVRRIFADAMLYHWNGAKQYRIKSKAMLLSDEFEQKYIDILTEDEVSQKIRQQLIASMEEEASNQNESNRAHPRLISDSFQFNASDISNYSEYDDSSEDISHSDDEEYDEMESKNEEICQMQKTLQQLTEFTDVQTMKETNDYMHEIRLDLMIAQKINRESPKLQKLRFLKRMHASQLLMERKEEQKDMISYRTSRRRRPRWNQSISSRPSQTFLRSHDLSIRYAVNFPQSITLKAVATAITSRRGSADSQLDECENENECESDIEFEELPLEMTDSKLIEEHTDDLWAQMPLVSAEILESAKRSDGVTYFDAERLICCDSMSAVMLLEDQFFGYTHNYIKAQFMSHFGKLRVGRDLFVSKLHFIFDGHKEFEWVRLNLPKYFVSPKSILPMECMKNMNETNEIRTKLFGLLQILQPNPNETSQNDVIYRHKLYLFELLKLSGVIIADVDNDECTTDYDEFVLDLNEISDDDGIIDMDEYVINSLIRPKAKPGHTPMVKLESANFDIFEDDTQNNALNELSENSQKYATQSAMNANDANNNDQNTQNNDNANDDNYAPNDNESSNHENNGNQANNSQNPGDDGGDEDEKKNDQNNNNNDNNDENKEDEDEKKEEEQKENEQEIQVVNMPNPPVINDNNNNNNNKRFHVICFIFGTLFCAILAIILGTDWLSSSEHKSHTNSDHFFKQTRDFLKIYDAEINEREKYLSHEPFLSDIDENNPSQNWIDSLHIGSLIDALDVEKKWYTAYVTNMDKKSEIIKIHYDDWTDRFDEWLDPKSGKVAPYRSRAIGGRLQGGLPGRPALPIKPENKSTLSPFQLMRLGFLQQNLQLPDVNITKVSDLSIREYEELFTSSIFYEIGIIFNDRAVYMNEQKIYIFFNHLHPSWCISSGYPLIDHMLTCVQSDALRPDLINDKLISFEQAKFVPEYKSKSTDYKKYKKLGNDGLMNIPTTTINKVMMPQFIVGTHNLPFDERSNILHYAAKLGYYMYDTAMQNFENPSYWNHKYLHELFDLYSRGMIGISTKVPSAFHGYHSTIANIAHQLHTLGTDYIDLVIIESPNCAKGVECEGPWIDSWRAMEYFYEKGRIRSLGVSGFDVLQLKLLLQHKQKHIPLSVVRGRRDPLHLNSDVVTWCQTNNILFQAYSPLGGQYYDDDDDDESESNMILSHPIIEQIGIENGLTPAQVVIRWNIQQGVGVVVKSSDIEHLKENLKTFSLKKLSNDDLYDIGYRIKYDLKREPKKMNEDGTYGDKSRSDKLMDINALMDELMGDILNLQKREDKGEKKEEEDDEPLRRRHMVEDDEEEQVHDEGDVDLRDDDL